MTTINLYSLVLAILTAGSAGLVGSFALMKRMSLAGDVISHIALPGLGLAFLFKINPLIGGAATLFLGTLLIWQLGKKTALSTETTIGVVFAASVAIGALVTPTEDLIEALFGGFQKPALPGFLIGLLATFIILVFISRFKDRLILGLFSPELASATGVNLNRLNLYFLLIFSLTVWVGLQFLGALLVGALIIIPAAIGRQLAHNLGTFLTASALSGALSVVLGFLINYFYPNLALGPTIVSISALLFVLSLLRKKA
jgi:ABC-type Mn2+/Zn2+ transport system permease subunit